MNACFADSYYFFAMLNPRDEAHSAAVSLGTKLRRPLVTTSWVLTEVADGLAATSSRRLFGRLLQQLQMNPHTTIVPPTSNLFEAGTKLYDSRSDKSWSLTDCISFTVMEQLEMMDALTADHHFVQAGFRTLF